MSDLWRVAGEASERFAAHALDYDRYRPRYPDTVFADIIESAKLTPGARAIEIGAGTGIATAPLVERGLQVTAIEPASALAALGKSRLDDRAQFVIGRFEDYSSDSAVQLLTAFNAWHWVDPTIAVDLAARLLAPSGSLALIWTEVLSWGEDPFEERLAKTFGSPWAKKMDDVQRSLQPVRQNPKFGELREHHHPFERTLDASTFVAVTKTYGGHRTMEQYEALERMINEDFGGAVTKVEDAALYLATRL